MSEKDKLGLIGVGLIILTFVGIYVAALALS